MDDNWALIYAQDIALELRQPLAVIFCLVSGFLGATIRQYDFMLRGLQEVAERLSEKNIPLFLLIGNPVRVVPDFVKKHNIGFLVTDFDPLKIKRRWKNRYCFSRSRCS